jgi:DNA-directed RNA polymerase subunit N (RpoN/RPB10)
LNAGGAATQQKKPRDKPTSRAMHPPVKCATCGSLLGHVYRLFQDMRGKVNESKGENLYEVFQLLHIERICCKTRLMTARQFNSFLHDE